MTRLRRLAASDGVAGRLSRYVLVGGSAAVVDLGGFVLLSLAGFGVGPAAATSFAMAAVWNFTLSSRLVFRVAASWRRFALFGAFALVGLAVNTGVTVAAAHWLPGAMAKTIGIGVAFGVNFWLNHAIVFDRDATVPPRPGGA